MIRLRIGCLLCLSLVGILLSTSAGAASEDTLRVAPFGKVTLYRQSDQPTHVVLFISGDGGWNKGVVDMARILSEMDALVAGVDITHLLKALDESRERCLYPAADFENLSKVVQQHCGFTRYVPPVLVGYSSGATLVYAALVQAPPTTFRGGISLGFCPDLQTRTPFCKGSGLEWKTLPKDRGWWFLPTDKLEVPWIALQGLVDQVCPPDSTIRYLGQVKNGRVVELPKVGHGYAVFANWVPQFKEAFRQVLNSQNPDPAAVTVPELPGLPLEVVEASGPPSDWMALHITGDGGWGVTDKGLSQTFASRGIPVVGLNALHYFWSPKTPETTAEDVARILRHYLGAWNKSKILLIGYSFGADVLPFVVSRLPEDLRAKLGLVVFLGLGGDADFQFHLTSWLGGSRKNAQPTRPEVEKLRGTKMLCLYGQEDSGAICKDLPADLIQSVVLAGGHRIGRDFEVVAEQILQAAQ